MTHQLVQQMADDNGVISEQFETTEQNQDQIVEDVLDVEINIREDGVTLFETEDSRLFIRSESMEQGVFVEAVPTTEGPQPQLVIEPQEKMVEIEPADQREQPDVSQSTNIEVRMD